MQSTLRNRLLIAVAVCGLTACGGGGGVNSTPTATQTPTLTSSAVDIFPSPTSQEFTSVGTGSDLRIRYDSVSKKYEVMVDNGWIQLVDDPLSSPLPGQPNQMFRLAGVQSGFIISAHHSLSAPELQYRYSNLAQWAVPSAGSQTSLSGVTAFGMATPTGGVPVSGSASYQGLIQGSSTLTGPWGWDGQASAAGLHGSVLLNFNFNNGSLTGELHPYLMADKQYDLGTLTFANTIYGAGSQTFSGIFATNVSGPNSFSGLFTGPHAEELIGKWAFPFLSPIDGAPHSGAGAWIAKKGP